MKTIDFNDYQKNRAGFLKIHARLNLKRAPARRKRDQTERQLLLRINKNRWESWLATGKLKKLGKRRYRLD